MRTALLAFVILLGAAPAAQAASVKVTWPSTRELSPGATVSVTVAAKRAVKLSIVRTNAAGTPIATVARRSLKRGTLSARLDRVGTYAVRVGERSRKLAVLAPPAPPSIPAPLPSAPVMIDSADCVRATNPTVTVLPIPPVTVGTSFSYVVQSTSDGCILMGLSHGLEHLQADGTWKQVPWDLVFPAMAVLIQPGATDQRGVHIPADAAPGSYRIIQPFAAEPAPFEVVAAPASAER